MPQRPPTLSFEGMNETEAYAAARLEFAGNLLMAPVKEISRGRQALFTFGIRSDPELPPYCRPLDPPQYDDSGRLKDDCWHVCFKQAEGVRDPHNKRPRDQFNAERARRIPWIHSALTSEDTRIHESPDRIERDRESFSIWVPGDPRTNTPNEFFAVIVRRLPNPEEVAFITAYPVWNQQEIDKLRQRGPQLFPVKKKPKVKKKGK